MFFGFYTWKTADLFLNQHQLVYFPDHQWHRTPNTLDMPYEDISFQSADGVRLSGWFILADKPIGTVLYCHGNAGNISLRLEEVGIYRGLGLNVFIFDYRGYGKSQGIPTEEGTYKDAQAAWNYLIQKRGVKEDEVIIAGRSLGAAIAVYLAAEHPPKALVLESGFTSLPDVGQELYPYFPVRFLLKYRYPTLSFIQKIHAPTLVIHSREDKIIPFHHSTKIFDALSGPKQFLDITGPHNEGYWQNAERYRQALKGFLDLVDESKMGTKLIKSVRT